jgi:hypothetical protein
MAYVSTKARLGQGIHYTPRVLRQDEFDISFGVFVGDTEVATLVRGDWFDEASLLSVFVTRAHVVCEKKSSELHVVGGAHLSVMLAAQPDLAATFFSVMAYELVIRVNMALMQYVRALSDRGDISADAHSGRHVMNTSFKCGSSRE